MIKIKIKLKLNGISVLNKLIITIYITLYELRNI